MKTTVKLDGYSSIVIQPEKGSVSLSLLMGGIPLKTQLLTLDQCGAILSGIEQAAAVAGGVML